jgi:hypothetical protein
VTLVGGALAAFAARTPGIVGGGSGGAGNVAVAADGGALLTGVGMPGLHVLDAAGSA